MFYLILFSVSFSDKKEAPPLGSFPASGLQRLLSHPLQSVLSSYSEEKLSSILARVFAGRMIDKGNIVKIRYL